MKKRSQIILAGLLILLGAAEAIAIEEAAYSVVLKEGKFEIRDYAPHIIAETIVEGDLEGAGSKAFKKLYHYISGANRPRNQAVTIAAVAATAGGEKIAMTAPVGQLQIREKWAVSFMMPVASTLETLPLPDDPEVSLRQVPGQRRAVVRYSGTWSEKNYQQNRLALEEWMLKKGLPAEGEALWARYNPPFTPWFWRRNEILIPTLTPTPECP